MKTSRHADGIPAARPAFASAHNFQLQQRVSPVGVSDKESSITLTVILATRTGTARSSVEKCE